MSGPTLERKLGEFGKLLGRGEVGAQGGGNKINKVANSSALL
jgi:hypothetical protein